MVCAMKKAGVLAILFVVILLAAVIVEAQQSVKVAKIGLLRGALRMRQTLRLTYCGESFVYSAMLRVRT
jgi:hypothetical protein